MRVTVFKDGEKPRYFRVSGWKHAKFELVKDKNDFDLAIFTDGSNNHKLITPFQMAKWDNPDALIEDEKQ